MSGTCVRPAKLGYFATAPELFAREGDVNTMTDLQTILDTLTAKILGSQVATDIDSAIARAGATKKADVERLGITGFCRAAIKWLYAAGIPAGRFQTGRSRKPKQGRTALDLTRSQLLSLTPSTRFSRRGMIAGGLSAGFALAGQPVAATTITTDTKGLARGTCASRWLTACFPAFVRCPRRAARSQRSSC